MKRVPAPGAFLCEACGYPLVESDDPAAAWPLACPECGRLAAASRPGRRAGPPWGRGMSPRSFLATATGLLRGPRWFFGRLAPGGPGLPPRLYLLAFATLVGAGWALTERWWLGRPPVLAWGHGMIAGQAVVALTYVEVLGVTLFSRLKGWRVPLPLAEKVACYAAPAWAPGAAVALLLERVHRDGGWGPVVGSLTGDPLLGLNLRWGLWVLGAAAVVLPYESVVSRGVKAVRYANGAALPPAAG